MKSFVLCLFLAGMVLASVLAAKHWNAPPLSAVISDGGNVTDAAQYAEEFAEALSVSTQMNTGAPLTEPYIYLSQNSEALRSPDGALSLNQRQLENYYQEIMLSGPGDQLRSILVIQGRNPTSGSSHGCQWSRDSKAVFIYGDGTPLGHSLTLDMALVYLVDRRTLYYIDLSPHLSKRLKRMGVNAPEIQNNRRFEAVKKP